MNFVSYEFLLFFPLVLVLYWWLPSQYRWIILLLASYFFYLYWNPWTMPLLLGTSFISYIAARKIARGESKKQRDLWLIFALVVCLGCLIIFKYLGFITENTLGVLQFFGAPVNDVVLNIILPVGISFYTFQTLSYVIDVYRGDISHETHFGYYALFISFFPQLVAGPIERPGHLLPQLHMPKVFKATNLITGLHLMLRGFFKKLVIADYLAKFVDVVYGAPTKASGPGILIATVLFAFQIYCDFSGYSDIAVGTAKMMGIQLMKNFNNPYSATSVQDFWRRWHISLTDWFADYIYKPLGGNRKGGRRHARNILIVFLISGAWHGASWTYIIWGGIHGIYLVVENLWKNYSEGHRESQPTYMSQMAKRLITFAFVCFAWLFFRGNSLGDVGVLLGKLWSEWSIDDFASTFIMMQLGITDMIRMILMFLCLQLFDKEQFSPEYKSEDDATLQGSAGSALIIFKMITIITLAWLSLVSVNASSSFIYFQF